MENKCPICSRHCDLSHPHCPRGQEYVKNGIVTHSRIKFNNNIKA